MERFFNAEKGKYKRFLSGILMLNWYRYLNIVICCPLTTKVKNYKGNLVIQPSSTNGLTTTSEVLTFHIRSISKERLVKKLGSVSPNQIQEVKSCLGDLLTY